MKNILIFASLAGLASAIAIYFVTEGSKTSGRGTNRYSENTLTSDSGDFVTDADIENYNIAENTGPAQAV